MGAAEDISPSVIADECLSIIDHDNLSAILATQKRILNRFEKNNEMLCTLSELSSMRYDVISSEIRQNIRVLTTMKHDLDSIFKRIRALKSSCSEAFPAEYNVIFEREKLIEAKRDEEEGMLAASSLICPAIPEMPSKRTIMEPLSEEAPSDSV
ncbi:unnamed protein product [Protopolystoma xenopodis]|uniref:KxDL domain-containing protein n=1 Tax=Protopolystoma xenopodis TaxID=117903 RepID=A0A448WQ34_9PLAT|nr:unnamed protein product [Protopolystoma xenopodis]